MLFYYKYISSDIEKIQKWLDFLFIYVWCNATKDYNVKKLYKYCPELLDIIIKESIREEEPDSTKHISKPIHDIYLEFAELDKKQKKVLRKWYKRNRKIEKICNNEPLYKPLSCSIIDKIAKNKTLSKKIKSFYSNLFGKGIDLASIRSKSTTVEKHYNSFIRINNKGVCPFCGLATLRTYEMDGNEAYDHYLPKHKYPLNALNFKNLVPSCHHCNSTYKNQSDPIYDIDNHNQRRLAFYPYANKEINISIECNVSFSDIRSFNHSDLTFIFKSTKDKKRLKTWLEVYHIDSRYKDIICNESKGKAWLIDIWETYQESQEEGAIIYKNICKKAIKQPYTDDGFLKKPFLEACTSAGLF